MGQFTHSQLVMTGLLLCGTYESEIRVGQITEQLTSMFANLPSNILKFHTTIIHCFFDFVNATAFIPFICGNFICQKNQITCVASN